MPFEELEDGVFAGQSVWVGEDQTRLECCNGVIYLKMDGRWLFSPVETDIDRLKWRTAQLAKKARKRKQTS